MTDNDRITTIPGSFDSSVLYPLSRIVNDLWGEPAAAQKPRETFDSSPGAEAAEQKQAATATQKISFPEFGKLWVVADEQIEWTEALVHEKCPDGMTSPDTWSFLHTQAAAVLSGDIDSYHTVLQHCAPLADLTPYASRYDVNVLSGDAVEVTFECIPAYMGNSKESLRRYVGGLAMRTARDLMALLPLTEVQIHACFVGGTLLQVTYTREYLRSLRFGFIDAEKATLEAGGVFSGD